MIERIKISALLKFESVRMTKFNLKISKKNGFFWKISWFHGFLRFQLYWNCIKICLRVLNIKILISMLAQPSNMLYFKNSRFSCDLQNVKKFNIRYAPPRFWFSTWIKKGLFSKNESKKPSFQITLQLLTQR